MIRVGLVLAAGQSRRFGPANKLLHIYKGMEVAAHVAKAFQAADFDHRLVVVSDDRVAALFAGFQVVRMGRQDGQQSDSLRLGVSLAASLGGERLLVGLADMPRMTAGTLNRILARCTDTTASCATGDAGPMPPACFSAAYFPALKALTGDRGAGGLLRELPVSSYVRVPPNQLRDIDTQVDLDRLDQADATD